MQYPTSQPDEGYSEDPLNPSIMATSASSITAPAKLDDVPAWLAKILPYLPVSARKEIAVALLDNLPTSVVAEIAERVHPRLYIDFIQYLPQEVCLKILGYLDPVSLLSVARSCRGWYSLAVDRKLWEKLYHMEGWRAVYPEIQAREDMKNSGVSSQHRVVAAEDGHARKKRAISEDDDLEMTDADRSSRPEDGAAGSSLFGSPMLTTPPAPMATVMEMDVDESDPSSSRARTGDSLASADVKGKGRSVTKEGISMPISPPGGNTASLINSELWTWDAPSRKYRLNWKYIYTLRRRLESNWEQGKYVNFQLPRPDHPEEGHLECIYTLQFDSKFLVSGSRDRTIRIWSMGNRRLVRPPLRGHEGSVLCLQFDADPEEDLVVSGSSDSNVILWRFSTGEIIQRLTKAHSESVLNVKFDRRILVTCSKDKSIKVFNRRPLKYGEPGYNDPELLNPVPIRVRDYRYNNPADELPLRPAYTLIARLEGHSAAVNAVQIHENEIVSASGDRNIKVWDWAKQVCSRTVLGHGKGIACVQYDGRRIVSGSSDNEVKVFDRFTGLEVASLRAHTNLVRTVQAGFGDLPYSEHEDRAEARKIDEEYFKALESGAIPQDHSNHRSRPRNAGSRRPEDITAFGATLPPGGGGGKYARIISGSYDQKIIIWRRDKDGVWEPAHRLRQEDAAEAAQHWAARTGTVPAPAAPQGIVGGAAFAPAPAAAAASAAPTANASQPAPQQQSQPLPRPSLSSTTSAPTPSTSSAQTPGGIPPPIPPRAMMEEPNVSSFSPQAAQSFMALIDIVVPQGPNALQQALAGYPAMLAYHAHIQAAVTRETSPVTRSHLRQVVATALHANQNAQNSQSRNRLASMQTAIGPIVPPSLPSLSSLQGSGSSMAGMSGSSTAAQGGSGSSTQGSNRGFDPIRHVGGRAESPRPYATPGSSNAQVPPTQPNHQHRLAAHASNSQPGAAPQLAGHIHIQTSNVPGPQSQGSQSGSSTPNRAQQTQGQSHAPTAPVQAHSVPAPAPQGQQPAQQAQGAAPQGGAQPAAQPQEGQVPHHPHITNADS
ncbi:F-box/WD repeat-containing protein 1A, partial [Plectosphaerella plurivora]